MHGGLPHHCVFPQEPLSWSNDPTNTTGQQAHPVFHTRSLFGLSRRWTAERATSATSLSETPTGSPGLDRDHASGHSDDHGKASGAEAAGCWPAYLEEDGSVIPSVEELALLPTGGDDGEEDYLGGNGTEWSPGL